MNEILLKSSKWDLFRVVSDAEGIDDVRVKSLASAVLRMHEVVPLELFKVSVPDPSSPDEADYLIKAVDGRVWRQVIYGRTEDPPMSFSVPDLWRRSEFSNHRAMRDHAVWLWARSNLQEITARPT